jgi:hypothetical protein
MRRSSTVFGAAAVGFCSLVLATALSACGEDGKTAPEKCAEPPLPIFDLQLAGAPSVDNPCVTPPGHAISGVNTDAAGSGGT